MATTTRLLTLEQFEMIYWPEDGRKRELVCGEVVEEPMPGGPHTWIVGNIYRLLFAFVSQQRLGVVFVDGMRYVLSYNAPTERVPDVSFVARDRVALPFPPVWPFAPDLAVEVVSPSDRMEAVHAKMENYLASGTRLVWLVWPDTQTVTVHAPDAETRTRTANDTLDGGEVLPGFAVPVAELFTVDL